LLQAGHNTEFTPQNDCEMRTPPGQGAVKSGHIASTTGAQQEHNAPTLADVCRSIESCHELPEFIRAAVLALLSTVGVDATTSIPRDSKRSGAFSSLKGTRTRSGAEKASRMRGNANDGHGDNR